MNTAPPVALTIAGSDPSSGAGIQADLKTFAAHRVYGLCAITALVAQIPGAVLHIEPSDSQLLGSQLQMLGESFPIKSIKTGMLATAAHVAEVIRFMKDHPDLPLIVDPVMRASADFELLSAEGIELMKAELLPLAALTTPNRLEAEQLLGHEIRTPDEFRTAPEQLQSIYGCNFLVKGGHFDGPEVSDFLRVDGETYSFSRPRLQVPDVHGTGCTLSAAIAARLALGSTLCEAVGQGITYLSASLQEHHLWRNNRGTIEALNHFPDSVEWPRP